MRTIEYVHTFPDVLPHDGDVVVPVRPRVLVVESERVHRLVEGAADVAQAVARLRVGRAEGELLAAAPTPDEGPTTRRHICKCMNSVDYPDQPKWRVYYQLTRPISS